MRAHSVRPARQPSVCSRARVLTEEPGEPPLRARIVIQSLGIGGAVMIVFGPASVPSHRARSPSDTNHAARVRCNRASRSGKGNGHLLCAGALWPMPDFFGWGFATPGSALL